MNLILAAALADDHRRDLLLDAEDRRMVRLSRSPITKRRAASQSRTRRLFRSHGQQSHRPNLGYRDWLTAGRL